MENTYFKLGQTVYCALFGEGKIVKISNDDCYPLNIRFLSKDSDIKYTIDGRWLTSSLVTLSQNPIEPIINIPIIEFKKGDLVLVSDNQKNWYIRFFIEIDHTRMYPYQATSSSNLLSHGGWTYCKKYQP